MVYNELLAILKKCSIEFRCRIIYLHSLLLVLRMAIQPFRILLVKTAGLYFMEWLEKGPARGVMERGLKAKKAEKRCPRSLERSATRFLLCTACTKNVIQVE